MNTKIIRKAQAGFTLIELIVVIVILGILAATALPRMFDMSGQARLAKMQAALGAVRAASSTAHAAWLVNGGLNPCTNCGVGGIPASGSAVTAEGQNIVMIGGYPDVGGDGLTNNASTPTGGMVVAANLGTDYVITTVAAGGNTATNNNLTISADAAHPNCRFTYTEATQDAGTAGTAGAAGVPPKSLVAPIFTSNLTLDNCS